MMASRSWWGWCVFAAVGSWMGAPGGASAICRVVEPSTDSGRAPVAFDAETDAFYVVSPDVIVDWRCPPPPEEDAGAIDADAGVPDDAGEPDAGEPDAGAIGRAHAPRGRGVEVADAGLPEGAGGGAELDASIASIDASIDGGGAPTCWDGSFAEPVVGTVVSLVVRPRLYAAGGSAGLIMPVPARPDVALGPSGLFTSLAQQVRGTAGDAGTVHETVIVTEDASLGFQCTDPHYVGDASDAVIGDALEGALAGALFPLLLTGCGGSASSDYYRPGTATRDASIVSYGDAGEVIVEEIPAGEDYDATAISATTIDALTMWLDGHGFAHSAIDDEAFAHYVGPGRWFVALDVHPRDLGGAEVALQPLVVTWIGEEVPVTHRLQFDPRGGTLITNAWVMAPTRVDASDESAETLSSHAAILSGDLAGFGLRTGWLTRMRIGRLQQQDIPDAVLISAHVGEEVLSEIDGPIERTTHVRIPLACCAGGGVASSAAPPRTFSYERTYPAAGPVPPIPEAWFHSPEHATTETFCSSAGYSDGWLCSVAGTTASWGPLVLATLALTWRRRRALARRS